jgi:hypothetical protein
MIELPTMKGNARHARGTGDFEVPLFSHIKDNLWMGCSPAEFPDPVAENMSDYLNILLGYPAANPVNCKWLMEWDSILLMDRPRFNAILNLYRWGKYKVPDGVEYEEREMYDRYGEVDSEQLAELTSLVLSWLRAGKKVLVHCQAGLNRSSLVVASVLMQHYDMSAREAIDLIRSQRSPVCLCNEDFEKYLLKLDRGEW